MKDHLDTEHDSNADANGAGPKPENLAGGTRETKDPFGNWQTSDVLWFYMLVIDAVAMGFIVHGIFTGSMKYFFMTLAIASIAFFVGLMSVDTYEDELKKKK